MELNDIVISRKIIERFNEEFLDNLETDVIVVGAGPAGLVAAKHIADKGKKVIIIERRLSPGGGMLGGGMTMPIIVIQGSSKHILEEVGVKVTDAGDGYYTADSVECTAKLMSAAIDSGVRIFNAMTVEDVMMKEGSICGAVINRSAIEVAGLHVDPLTLGTKAIVDATGHAAEVCRVTQKKAGALNTPSGVIEGEKSMWAEIGEKTVVENTREVFPNLFVAGMACNAVMGAPRMGPIFGGMFLSGVKVADMVASKIE